ncbi:MAG: TraR/DksA family transcriptional regulator [Bdellovibrionales bacterium]|nr:TraR/DksA family transcriptional regulator [Bdellovibrionales bacterium]
MERLSATLIEECKARLLAAKSETLNRFSQNRMDYDSRDDRGDEVDQTMRTLAENQYLTNQNRLRVQLLEIESALARIETGAFGFCEETAEPIEAQRLLAIPWTRLSIEGAEMRESLSSKFGR